MDLKQDGAANPLLGSEVERSTVEPRSAKRHVHTRFIVGLFLGVALLVSIPVTKVFRHCVQHHHGQSEEVALSAPSVPHVARSNPSSLLEDFQVYPPVLEVTPGGVLEITDGSSNGSVEIVNSNRPTCQQVLVVYDFGNSYGHPFVGQYTPPKCAFNRVSWNLTVESAGVQYDRLATVWLGNVELFRTSTAEPSTDGVRWTYIKDMTNFLPLFKTNQELIFDLGNELSSSLTGIYNVTLTASYFTAGDSITPADLILPVSTDQASQGQSSLFTVPPQTASNNLKFPRNVKKAIFTVAATGQSAEEFWWSNVPQSAVSTFPGLDGYSPFREVQLYIDGMLAGVAWPWPIIFTGGVVPGLWRPIVGIDAFDLKEDEIDITPWLPLLCDGKSHNFTIRVSGLNDNGNGEATLSETTDGYWLVSGKAFIWLDVPGHITTGSGPHKTLPAPNFQVSSTVTQHKGVNESLVYSVHAQREISIQSTIKTSSGTQNVFWKQSRSYSNFGNYSDQGNVEINQQQTNGYDVSSSGYARQIDYPLYAYLTVSQPPQQLIFDATVQRSKNVKTIGQPVFPTGLESFAAAEAFNSRYPSFEGASLATTQHGHAIYIQNTTTGSAISFGDTTQQMLFQGIQVGPADTTAFPPVTGNVELFNRDVSSTNSTVTHDSETLIDKPIGHNYGHGVPSIRDFVIKRLPEHKITPPT